jgi:hypothetical protein
MRLKKRYFLLPVPVASQLIGKDSKTLRDRGPFQQNQGGPGLMADVTKTAAPKVGYGV